VDPFRSELHSAQERIGALESEVVRLRGELELARRPKNSAPPRKPGPWFIAIGIFGGVLLIVFPFFLFARHRSPSVQVVRTPAAFASDEGIAIAPDPATGQPMTSDSRAASEVAAIDDTAGEGTASEDTDVERARRLPLQGPRRRRMVLTSQLEDRVFSGKASEKEVDRLISACREIDDWPCVRSALALKSQRQQTRDH
jgi:hypothetical protein